MASAAFLIKNENIYGSKRSKNIYVPLNSTRCYRRSRLWRSEGDPIFKRYRSGIDDADKCPKCDRDINFSPECCQCLAGCFRNKDVYKKKKRKLTYTMSDSAQRTLYKTQFDKKGKLVTFFRNGDPHFRPITIAINPKWFQNMETLQLLLSEKISTPAGVRHIFRLSDAKEIKNVNEFREGEAYVVSSVRKMNRDVSYGSSAEKFWHNRPPSTRKFRRNEHHLLIDGSKFEDTNEIETISSNHSHHNSTRLRKHQNGFHPVTTPRNGRPIILVCNTDRSIQERVFVSSKSFQNFEDMLFDFTSLLKMEHPPVQTLYTAEPPFRRVCSFSQLFREFKDVDKFIACGLEFVPLELKPGKRTAPVSSSSPSSGAPQQSPPSYRPPPEKTERKLPPPPAPGTEYREFVRHETMPRKLPRKETTNHHVSCECVDCALKPYANHHDKAVQYEPIPISRNGELTFDRDRFLDEEIKDYPESQEQPSTGKELVKPIIFPVKDKPRAFWPPSNIEKDGIYKLNKKFRLNWIYGYNSGVSHGGMAVLLKGEIIYSVGRAIILYNSTNSTQRHYMEHSSQITSLCVHPSNLYIASGQQEVNETGSRASIRIWDCDNLSTFCVIQDNGFRQGIYSLDFSKETSGEYLLALDGSQGTHRQSIYMLDWRNQRVISRTKTSHDLVVGVRFHPDNDSTIITFGRIHIHFWRLFWTPETDPKAKILRDKKSGLFPDQIPDCVLCVAFDLVGNVVSGDSNGSLRVWTRDEEDAYISRSVSHLQNAHKGPLASLMMIGDGTLVSSSGNYIRAWDTLSDYSFLKERTLQGSWGNVTCLASRHPDNLDGNLIIGTNRCCILEGSLQDKFQCIIQQHSKGHMTLAAHPSEHSLVTAGQDCLLCKWSALQHKVMWTSAVDKPCRCVAYHPKGHLVTVGSVSGRFSIYKNEDGSHVMTCQIDSFNHPISSLRYSKDGSYLALGCEDGNIYIYKVQDDGIVYRKWNGGALKGHLSPVREIDWCKSSRYLRSQSDDDHIKHWDVENMKLVTEGAKFRDIKFSTHSCFYSYDVSGIWKSRKNHNIQVFGKANCGDAIAIGDSFGTVEIYHYPAYISDKVNCYSQCLHLGSVHGITFLFDDSFILTSAGDEPCALFQWSVTKSE